jgi:hypothetical protein
MEPTRRVRYIEGALTAATALVGVFAGFQMIYVVAAVAVLVVVFTANELWWAWNEANRHLEAEARGQSVDRPQRDSAF